MEIFNMRIIEVISEESLNRVVRVTMIREFYDGKKKVILGFFPVEWAKYKAQKSYPENRALDEREIAYYENMSDKDWCQSRHDAKLKDFTDAEIVAEFNRRLDSPLFHKIVIQGRAAVRGEQTDESTRPK